MVLEKLNSEDLKIFKNYYEKIYKQNNKSNNNRKLLVEKNISAERVVSLIIIFVEIDTARKGGFLTFKNFLQIKSYEK